MPSEAALDVVGLIQQRRRHYELHATVAASYEVAARLHAELAAKFDAAGQRGRAQAERELATERTRMARIADHNARKFQS